MNRISFLLLPFCILFCVGACKDKSAEEIALGKMHEEVMAVHDEVMPRISEVNRLARQFKNLLKESTDAEQSDALQKIIADLEAADEGMMNWMYEFKKPASANFEEAKAYYEEEMLKVEKVRTDIRTSIENAQKYLTQ